MKRLIATAALVAVLAGCGPAAKPHPPSAHQWTPAKRYEGCCRPQALAAPRPPAVTNTAQSEFDRLRERAEAAAKRFQRARERAAAAEAYRKRQEAERRAREAAEARAWEATKADIMALDLGARKERLEKLLADAAGNPARRRRVMRLIDLHNGEVERKVAESQRELDGFVDELRRMITEGGQDERQPDGLRPDES